MIAQGISEAMVEAILLNPQWTPPTTRGVRYDSVIDGRRVCVVVDAGDETSVVTAFLYREN